MFNLIIKNTFTLKRGKMFYIFQAVAFHFKIILKIYNILPRFKVKVSL